MSATNTATVSIQIEVDNKGGVKAVRAMDKEFADLGKKGKNSLKDIGDQTGRLKIGFAALLPTVAGFASIFTSGALLRGAMQVGEAFNQAYFQMSYTFGERTNAMIATAERMAERFRYFYDVVDISYAFTKTADSMERYGITGQHYLDLVARAADIGAAKNLALKESIDRLESAMRGEAEASEYLGLTLNDTYMKNIAFNGALKDTWEKMSDLEKAQYRYQELMQQSAKYTGAAQNATQNLGGSVDRFVHIIQNKMSPAMTLINRELARFMNFVSDSIQGPELAQMLENEIAGLENRLKTYDRLGAGGGAAIDKIKGRIQTLRASLEELRNPTADLSIDYGELNSSIDHGTISAADAAKAAKELQRQIEALDEAVRASNSNPWDLTGYDIDKGGIDQVSAAIQQMEMERNNMRIAAARKIAEQMGVEDTYDLDRGDMMAGLEEDLDRMVQLTEHTADAMQQNFSDLFFDVMQRKFSNLGDYMDAVTRSIQRAGADLTGQALTQYLFKTAAHGDVFSGRGISAYENSIVDRPTFFRFAQGAAVMGEAGAEAVMPLTRTSSGDLGVKALAPQIKVEINPVNESGMQLEVQPRIIQQTTDKIVANMVIKRKMTSRDFRRTMGG